MLEALAVRPRICQQIRSGPLGQWIDDFVNVIVIRGYATGVIRRHVRAAVIFSEWLKQQRVAVTQIDEPRVTYFVNGRARWRVHSTFHRTRIGAPYFTFRTNSDSTSTGSKSTRNNNQSRCSFVTLASFLRTWPARTRKSNLKIKSVYGR